jgi:hypothetical protein
MDFKSFTFYICIFYTKQIMAYWAEIWIFMPCLGIFNVALMQHVLHCDVLQHNGL